MKNGNQTTRCKCLQFTEVTDDLLFILYTCSWVMMGCKMLHIPSVLGFSVQACVNMVKDDSYDHVTFFFPTSQLLVVFAPLNSQMCIHLCNEGLMHCTQTLLDSPPLCNCQQTVPADPASSRPALNLSKSCFSTFPHIFAKCMIVPIASVSNSPHSGLSYRSKYRCHFSSLCVAEASVICALTLSPASKSLRSFPLVHLDPNSESAEPPQHFHAGHGAQLDHISYVSTFIQVFFR